MIRFSHHHGPRLLAFFTSLFMSFIMSMVITWLNLGMVEDFFSRWMHAWGSSFVIAFPTILMVLPIARGIVARLVHTPRPEH